MNAPTSDTPDPILAAISRHREAWDAFGVACKRADPAEAALAEPSPRPIIGFGGRKRARAGLLQSFPQDASLDRKLDRCRPQICGADRPQYGPSLQSESSPRPCVSRRSSPPRAALDRKAPNTTAAGSRRRPFCDPPVLGRSVKFGPPKFVFLPGMCWPGA
jgi:hypothetical protein